MPDPCKLSRRAVIRSGALGAALVPLIAPFRSSALGRGASVTTSTPGADSRSEWLPTH